MAPGFLTFLEGQSDGCSGAASPCAGQRLPDSNGPNGLIAGYWEDLDPARGGTILYGTVGTAPDRRFIVEFAGVPHARGGNPVSFQIKLFESSNQIEIHCLSCASDGGKHTQGLEGASFLDFEGALKTNAYCFTTNPELELCVYGYNCSKLNKQNVLVVGERNASNLSFTNDAIRFTPPNNRAAITPVLTNGPGTITKDPFRPNAPCNFRVVVWLYPLHLHARVAIDLVGLPVPV